MVIDCDPEIGVYYRHLFWLAQNKCQTLIRPTWKEHISVIRNEEPPKNYLWSTYGNYPVSFCYDTELRTDGEYFWLDVVCPIVLRMRKELGLSAEPDPGLHLTIGHVATCEEAERIKKKLGFTECPVCGTGHRDKVVICRECGYKAGL
jgi:hypothetical protein